MGTLLLWWLAIELLGLVGLPLAALLCGALPDHGWALAKPLSLLIAGWLVWFPLVLAPALPYSRLWIAGTLLAFAAGNAVLLRLPGIWEGLRRLATRGWRYALLCEALFAVAFGLMAWIRSFTPAVVGTEKFMDEAFLAAIWRAPHLPPPDPWLSGYPLNYYYFGHFLLATLAKLLGTQPGTAFNTGIALIFALTAVAVAGVAANLVAVGRRLPTAGLWRAGLVGVASAVTVLVLGNLDAAQVWWQAMASYTSGPHATLPSPWAWWLHPALWSQLNWWTTWWAPSRVIPNTITEFPAFSFLLADLHAHVLALPFDALAVGIAYALLLRHGTGLGVYGRGVAGGVTLAVMAVALGSLYAINGWDLPTYLGLTLLALIIQQWLAHDRFISGVLLLDLFAAGALLVALSFLWYLPFYRGFSSPGEGLGIVPASAHTPIGYIVAMFGLPAFLALSWLALRLGELPILPFAPGARRMAAGGAALPWRVLAPLAVAAPVVALAALTWATAGASDWLLLWGLLVIGGCALLALARLGLGGGVASGVASGAGVTRWRDRADVWLCCLIGTATAVVLTCELIYLRDVFAGGPAFRMNTVFKLYYQAWLLLGIAAGPLAAQLLDAAGRALGWLAGAPAQAPAQAPAPQAATPTTVASPLPLTPPTGVMAVAGATLPAAETARAETAQVVEAADARLAGTPRGGIGAGTTASAEPPEARPPAGGRASAGAWRPPWKAAGLRVVGAGGIVLWIALLLGLVGAAAVYPVLATVSRTQAFSLPRTLDGTAYMATDPINQGDQLAIAWLNAHVRGDPVIVEAAEYQEYTEYGRISAFTGMPTLLGWGGHEYQWRVNWLAQPGHATVLQQRLAAVQQIYTNPDSRVVLALLRTYGARYLYVGAAERQLYPGANLARFAAFLPVVYTRAGVTIYAVPRGNGAG